MIDSQQDLLMAEAALNLPDSGACAFELADAELVGDPSGIVWWASERLMIVADLHLEKGSSFARRGILLPPYDSAATLNRLQKAIAYWRPKTVISLGDSFHDSDAWQRLPLDQRQQLVSLVGGCDWIWISGNHDPKPPTGFGGMAVDELSIGSLNFRHEPQPGDARGEVAGHLHPAARMVIRGRSIRRRCFATDNQRLIMPAFGAYTGGLNVLDPAFSGLFEQRRFYALMLGNEQVYKIPAGQLAL